MIKLPLVYKNEMRIQFHSCFARGNHSNHSVNGPLYTICILYIWKSENRINPVHTKNSHIMFRWLEINNGVGRIILLRVHRRLNYAASQMRLFYVLFIYDLYMNDFQEHLSTVYNGPRFTILYADYTVILLKTEKTKLFHYCNWWKFDINAKKWIFMVVKSNQECSRFYTR